MAIFELKPIDLSSDDWRASTYNRPVVIRAADERRARQIASLTFLIATPRVLGQPIPMNPWQQADLVSCQRIEDSDHAEDGDDAVLDPANYNDEFLRTQR